MPGPYDTATGVVVGFGVVVVVVVVVGVVVVVVVVVVDVDVVVGSEKSVDRYNHVQYLPVTSVTAPFQSCIQTAFFIIFIL